MLVPAIAQCLFVTPNSSAIENQIKFRNYVSGIVWLTNLSYYGQMIALNQS